MLPLATSEKWRTQKCNRKKSEVSLWVSIAVTMTNHCYSEWLLMNINFCVMGGQAKIFIIQCDWKNQITWSTRYTFVFMTTTNPMNIFDVSQNGTRMKEFHTISTLFTLFFINFFPLIFRFMHSFDMSGNAWTVNHLTTDWTGFLTVFFGNRIVCILVWQKCNIHTF